MDQPPEPPDEEDYAALSDAELETMFVRFVQARRQFTPVIAKMAAELNRRRWSYQRMSEASGESSTNLHRWVKYYLG